MSSINGIDIGEIPTGRFTELTQFRNGWGSFIGIVLIVFGICLLIVLVIGTFGKRKAEIIEADLKPPIFPPGGPF